MKNEHWLNSKTYTFHQQRIKSAKSCLPSQAIVKSKKPAQGTKPQLKFFSTTHNFDLTIDEKNEMFKIPIYQALKLQGLQQYVRELITMGFGYDLAHLSTMPDAKLNELIEQLKFLPGHKQRFLKLISDLRKTNLTNNDKKENSKENAVKKPRQIFSAPKKKPEQKKVAIHSEKSKKLEMAFSPSLPKFTPVHNENSTSKCFNVYSVIKPENRTLMKIDSEQLIADIIRRHTTQSHLLDASDKKKSQNSFQTASHKTFMDDFLPNFTPVKGQGHSVDNLRKTIDEELFCSNVQSTLAEKQEEKQNVTGVDLNGIDNLNLIDSISLEQVMLFVATMMSTAIFISANESQSARNNRGYSEAKCFELLDFFRNLSLNNQSISQNTLRLNFSSAMDSMMQDRSDYLSRANFVKALHKDTNKMVIRKSNNDELPLELTSSNRHFNLYTIPEQSVEYTVKDSQDFTFDNLSLVDKNSYARISNRLSVQKERSEDILPTVENVSALISQLSQEFDVTKELLLKAFTTFIMMTTIQTDVFDTCGWMSVVIIVLLRSAFNHNIQLLSKLKSELVIKIGLQSIQIPSEVITNLLTQNTELFEQIEVAISKSQQRILSHLGIEILNFNNQDN